MLNKNEIEILREMCSGFSIMIVEDEIALANDYKDLAKYFFDDITVVNDAHSALEKYAVNKFDIIYTDINMPVMNGVELIREIKSQDPKQAFIVLSASNEPNNLLELLKLKISIFILKPFQIDEFIDATADQVAILKQLKKVQEDSKKMAIELQKVTKEKKDQENMLIQQSKLAQTGEMVSMIVHQWRQPLSSITTQIAVLRTRLELGFYNDSQEPMEMLIKDLYQSFEKIEKSAIFLSDTINNFRNFYKPNNAIKTFNLTDVIETVLDMLMLTHSNILIEKDYLSSPDIMIESYDGELQQVLMSILNNARDAILEKNIENPKIKIATNSSETFSSIFIYDNAGGIVPDIIDNIFLPYFSTKTEKNGTGLGLHMAKKIIETHMFGSLYANNSKEENGACFTIQVPLKMKKECTI